MPTRGIERWLTQRLSAHLGATPGRRTACAPTSSSRFPARWSAGPWRRPPGTDPDGDPWLPERAVWPLLEVVEEHFDEPWLAPLAEHIRNSDDRWRESRRFSSVRHVADLFDRYGVHRPEMLQRGLPRTRRRRTRPGGRRSCGAGCGPRIGQPSPAERLRRGVPPAPRRARRCSTCRTRLSLFGLTRLPASYLDVLEAMAAERDVHLFLLHPSPALWERLEPEVGPALALAAPGRGPDGGRAAQPAARLVGSGRPRDAARARRGRPARGDAAELRTGRAPPTLLQRDPGRRPRRPAARGAPRAPRPTGARLLDRGRRQRPGPRLPRPGPPGRGAARRGPAPARGRSDARAARRHRHVPGHRDVRAADPGHVRRARAKTRAGDDPDGRCEVRLADRSLRQTNPVLGVLAELLELARPGSPPPRCSISPGASRCGGASASATTTWPGSRSGWTVRSSAGASTPRTALRSGSRRSAANTWRAGLDRILLGVAMADERQRLFGGALPLDDVDSGDIDLAGRLAEFVDACGRRSTRSAGPQTLTEWADTLAGRRPTRSTATAPARRLAAGPAHRRCSTTWCTRRPARGRGQPAWSSACADVRSIAGRPPEGPARPGRTSGPGT